MSLASERQWAQPQLLYLVLSLEKARVVSSHAASTSTVVNSLNGYSSKEKDPANGRDKQSLNSTLEFCKKSQLEAELQQAKQMAMTLHMLSISDFIC